MATANGAFPINKVGAAINAGTTNNVASGSAGSGSGHNHIASSASDGAHSHALSIDASSSLGPYMPIVTIMKI